MTMWATAQSRVPRQGDAEVMSELRENGWSDAGIARVFLMTEAAVRLMIKAYEEKQADGSGQARLNQ